MYTEFIHLHLRKSSTERTIILQTSFVKSVINCGRKDCPGSKILYKDGSMVETYEVEETVKEIARLVKAKAAY